MALGRTGTAALIAVAAFGWRVAAAPAQPADILITEVHPDPEIAGRDTDHEWIELHNPGPDPQDLTGWTLRDNRGADSLPAHELAPGGFVVVAGGEGFLASNPDYAGPLIVLDGALGNGLGNAGDRVVLADPDGEAVDAVSYGSDRSVLDPAPPAVQPGQSLARVPSGLDTDSAADWHRAPPSPGEAAEPSATVPPPDVTSEPGQTPPILLNEVLPAPKAVDWDGDGKADDRDEWVELFNPDVVDLDLLGWQLDDLSGGGSSPHVIGPGHLVPAGGHLVLFRAETGVALNNGGDSVRLLAPSGALVDVLTYSSTEADISIARLPDGGPWADGVAPSPGEANPSPSEPGTTPSPSEPGTTPSQPTPGASPRPGTAPPPGQTPALLPLLLSELFVDPAASPEWFGEWVEIYNPNNSSVRLSGWQLEDGTSADGLPDAVLAAGGFAVIAGASADTPVSDTLRLADDRIGNGLANAGDSLRIRDPTGRIVDAMSYGRDLSALDPSVPAAPEGHVLARVPSDKDTDTADDWQVLRLASPGRPNVAPVAPMRLTLTEVMPQPVDVDWNGDGRADAEDDWLEVANLGPDPVVLEEFDVIVGADRWRTRLPVGVLAPGAYRAIGRNETGLKLADHGDSVVLRRQDGVETSRVTWDASPGPDRSWARVAGEWVRSDPSPGRPNPAVVQSVSAETSGSGDGSTAPVRQVVPDQVRGLQSGIRVRVLGRVTAALHRLGRGVAYLGNADGGVRLYVPDGDDLVVSRGTELVVTGVVGRYRGETQVQTDRAQIQVLDEPGARPPRLVRSVGIDQVEPAAVGSLIQVSGKVVGWTSRDFTLQSGGSSLRVVLLRSTGLRRPWLTEGERRSVTGILGRYRARDADTLRLLPRDSDDLIGAAALPAGLPETGGRPVRGPGGATRPRRCFGTPAAAEAGTLGSAGGCAAESGR